ncbi:hypothetical protein [Pedobacter sp. BMA]|nr:hypothetical protein [Pedobacter sp. BMA]
MIGKSAQPWVRQDSNGTAQALTISPSIIAYAGMHGGDSDVRIARGG